MKTPSDAFQRQVNFFSDDQIKARMLLNTAGMAAGSFTNGQVALSTTAAKVVSARAGRCGILIRNVDTSINVYIGGPGVTSATGYLVKAGEAVNFETSGDIYAVAASGTPTVAYFETYDA